MNEYWNAQFRYISNFKNIVLSEFWCIKKSNNNSPPLRIFYERTLSNETVKMGLVLIAAISEQITSRSEQKVP